MDNTIAELIRRLARCQLDGEGECDEHGFVKPDYDSDGTPWCPLGDQQEVQPFDMPNDDAVEALSSFVVAARSLVAAGKVSTDIFRNAKIGTVDREVVYLTALLREYGPHVELSITADIRQSGRCVGGGQARDTVRAVAKRGHLAEGLTPALVEGLLEVWDRWHLNGLRAGCQHQRDFGWPRRPTDDVRSKPCPICDYGYGTAWKHEALPDYVVPFLRRFAVAAEEEVI